MHALTTCLYFLIRSKPQNDMDVTHALDAHTLAFIEICIRHAHSTAKNPFFVSGNRFYFFHGGNGNGMDNGPKSRWAVGDWRNEEMERACAAWPRPALHN